MRLHPIINNYRQIYFHRHYHYRLGPAMIPSFPWKEVCVSVLLPVVEVVVASLMTPFIILSSTPPSPPTVSPPPALCRHGHYVNYWRALLLLEVILQARIELEPLLLANSCLMLCLCASIAPQLLYVWYVLTTPRLRADLSQDWPGRFPIFLPSPVAQYVGYRTGQKKLYLYRPVLR